jgi:alanyl-tRNA synthetase
MSAGVKTGADIRESFLSFFEKRGHRRVASSPLVPQNDPTLLFTNAGMVQFKDVFTGREKRDYTRATTAQKCVRAGGKHNDLENVGFTARHLTFFEMLGNFSFGDYFKKDAVAFAWEWVTGVLAIPKDRLAVTIFKGEDGVPRDEEAFGYWHQDQNVPKERIHALGKKDNFWAMGDTGPCGPCSEIHFHQGDDLPCAEESAGRRCLGVECECDRWLEIWNLVFMQFERSADGKLTPLPKPSIDTGAGLERLAAVVQGKRTNFDTDLLRSVITKVEELSKTKYAGGTSDSDVSMRVIADHSRTTAFLVADGVLPSNEGRGYVLRRIMRRAIRYGARMGLSDLFLHHTANAVVALMERAYPELTASRSLIIEVAKQEEESFRRTLDKGLKMLSEIMDGMEKSGAKIREIPGKTVFFLFDTHGFPDDVTRLVAADRGFTIDEAGFKDEKKKAQSTSQEFAGSGEQAIEALYHRWRDKFGETAFLGYDTVSDRGTVLGLAVRRGEKFEEANTAKKGDVVDFVTDRTPFYAESGGQIGDTGEAKGPRGTVEVSDTQKPAGGTVVHRGRVTDGEFQVGDSLVLAVNGPRRQAIRLNHSGTHLLHYALREILGDHVKQAGSRVGPDDFTFDYTHFKALTPDQIAAIEDRVNELVRQNAAREIRVTSVEDARKHGAMMLFGEKYGDRVRMIRFGPSLELCGGTHVDRTGDIGALVIASDESVGAGKRRIVGVTGAEAVHRVREQRAQIQELSDALGVPPSQAKEKIGKLQAEIKRLEKEVENAHARQMTASRDDLIGKARDVRGFKVLAARIDPAEAKAYRDLADKFRDKKEIGVVALGGEKEGKALLLVAATQDAIGKGVHAGNIIKEIAKEIGGSGGGKPDLAQAGGSQPANIERALERVYELVERQVT